MEDLSHGKQVLIMTLSELAFLIPAIPLYVFFVVPNHTAETLPGILPLIGGGATAASSLAAACATLLLALFISVSLYALFGKSHFYNREMLELTKNFTEKDFVPIYLAAGIGEEALFRGALLEPCGLVVSSLLFTLLHIAYWRKPLMLAYVFLTGLLFGALYLYTKSLFLCIVVHFSFNLVVSILLKRNIVVPRG